MSGTTAALTQTSRTSILLPVELYINILTQVPSREPTTVLSFLSANSVTRAAALDQSVWHLLYHTRYVRDVRDKEVERRARLHGDWRQMYIERYTLDRKVLALLNSIRTRPYDQEELATQLTEDLSFDVWDALELEARLPIPRVLRDGAATEDMDEDPADEALPRRFWAKAALGVLARLDALRMWGRVGDAENPCSFEDMLLGLSAFTDVSPFKMLSILDELTARCRASLAAAGLEMDYGKPEFNLLQLVTSVRQFIHDDGFAVAEGTLFYFPFNQFPHYFLGAGRAHTIPMSIIFVMCAICRRLGIQAAPTNTRHRVLCHITSPDPQSGDILLDVCSTSAPVVFSSKRLPVMLAEAGMPLHMPPDSVTPADSVSLLTRIVLNAFATVQALPRSQHTDPDGYGMDRVLYAISIAFAVARRDAIHVVPRPSTDCPLDTQMVLFAGLIPLLPKERRAQVAQELGVIRSSFPSPNSPRYRPVKDANGEEIVLRAFVGQVVSLPQADFACVVGWKVTIDTASDRDSYDRLRHQVIYRVVTKAEMLEVHELTPRTFTQAELVWMRKRMYMFSRFFEDAYTPREDGRGWRLIPTHELCLQFPDDLEAGRLWSQEQRLRATG